MSRDSERFLEWFSGCPGVVVAFSGGVDSAVVLYGAMRALGRDRVVGAIATSASLKRSELDAARAFATAHDIPLTTVATSELSDPSYRANPRNRCYFCKSTLYAALAAPHVAPVPWWRLNGENADDRHDVRPGILAADQWSIRRPLSDLGLGKDQVRALAKEWELEVWAKPAQPCLSSRIPYGSEVNAEKLRQIEAAELVLAEHGFSSSRVRHFETTASVEVPTEDLPNLRARWSPIERALQSLGFHDVSYDPEGLVSGKLNRSVALPILEPREASAKRAI